MSLSKAESVMLVITRLPPTGRLRGTILASKAANLGGMDPEAHPTTADATTDCSIVFLQQKLPLRDVICSTSSMY